MSRRDILRNESDLVIVTVKYDGTTIAECLLESVARIDEPLRRSFYVVDGDADVVKSFWFRVTVICNLHFIAMVEVEDPLAIAHMLSMRHGYW
jgi:hypothetical protein